MRERGASRERAGSGYAVEATFLHLSAVQTLGRSPKVPMSCQSCYFVSELEFEGSARRAA
jgi:hypothetical protein